MGLLSASGRFNLLLDLQQQGGHLGSPVLLITLFDELQLSQMMGITQPMALMLELEIGSVIIVNWGALEVGQDANLPQRLGTPFGMHHVVG